MHSRARIAATIAKLLVCMLAVVCPGRSERTPGLGIVVTSQRVRIGNAVAPTGTTLFSGDVVSTFEAPAQVMLWGGSRVELLGASAAFSRPGDTLVIEARWGLLCFNIRGGERVRIKAPGGEFEVLSDAGPHVGSLAANANGQLALSLCQGAISGLAPGTEDVRPGKPFVALDQVGMGDLVRGRDTLRDSAKSWAIDSLEGATVRIGKEEHNIVANDANTLWIEGVWKLATGRYKYHIRNERLAALAATTSVLSRPLCMPAGAAAAIAPTAPPGVPLSPVGAWVAAAIEESQSDGSRRPPDR